MRLDGVSRVERRLEMVTAPETYGLSVTEVARLWKVSRETYYVWRRRYELYGEAGLENESTAPVWSPGRIADDLEGEIVKMRTAHRRWGARRILAELRRRGRTGLPARSTVHQVLKRNGLITATSRSPAATARFERERPNELWQIDALDHTLVEGTLVHIVSVLDDHSRLCCACRAWPDHQDGAAVVAVLAAAAASSGLPQAVLSDRAGYFTGRRTDTVCLFERFLWPLGVVTINSRSYHPQTQGKIERWHRTLREWLADTGPHHTLAELDAELDRFRQHYNHERPHQGIGDATPAERWHATPPAVPDPDGSSSRRRREALRTVRHDGRLSYGQWIIGLGRQWADTKIRLVDTGDTIRLYDATDDLITSLIPDATVDYLHGHTPHHKPRKPLT